MAFQLQKFSFKSLQKLSLSNRLQAAQDPVVGQMLISMLTPTQAAMLFPAYYRREMPDVSGFMKALPSSVSMAKQQEYERQIQNTTSGSASGANFKAGGWRRRYQENMDAERAQVSRRGTIPLPQLSPEQRQNFEALKASPLAVDDPRMKFLSTIDDSKLASVGITKYKESGKEYYKYSAPALSDEEVKSALRRGTASGTGTWAQDKEFMKEVNRVSDKFGIKANDLLSVMAFESGISASKTNPNGGATGLIQFMPKTAAAMGTTTEALRNMSRAEQMKYVEKYLEMNNIKPGSNAADIYSKVFLPARSGNDVLTVRGENFYEQNRGLDRDGDGRITKADLQSAALSAGRQHGVGISGNDPITTDYSAARVEAKRRELSSLLEAGRLQDLAQFSQADLPPPGSPQAQEMFSEGKSVDAVRKKVQSLTGMESSECVALAKAYVGATGSVTDWRRGNNVLDGNLQPGTPIATFMDRQGNPSTQYDGGQGRGAPGNHTTHAAVFMGYERDSSGKITGIRVMEQYANSGGPREKVYPANDSFGTSNAKNYYTINTSSGGPLGGVSPTQIAATAGQHEIRTAPPSTTPLDQFSRPILPEQKVQDTVPNITPPQQVAGPAAPTPAPAPEKTTAPTASVEAPKPKAPSAEKYNVDTTKFTAAIRQTEEFKSQAGMFGGMVPDSTIISGFNSDPRVVAAGVRLDEKGVMHFNKGMSEEAKSVMNGMNAKSFMTKIEEKKDTPTQVKPKADGGRTKVNTEEIAAYPIGGLRGDNAVVVNKQQQPLFTMNTNETAVMNPHNKTVDVIPNKKDGNIPPTQQDQAPMQNMVNEFHSAITELKNSFSENKAVPQKRIQEQPERDIDPNWITKLNQSTATPYRNPTAQRAMHRANGQETGDPTNGFHHSRGNIS